MIDDSFEIDVELITVIVNMGQGSKVLHKAKQFGITGGTVMLGKGTVSNKLLDFFCITDVRKEIVVMLAEKNIAMKATQELNKYFRFEKPNHGIAYTTPVCAAIGTRGCKGRIALNQGNEELSMYQAITVIVDKGKAEQVIDVAVKNGSKGGTIVNGRGSGLHETQKLFMMDIEPEKEIVLILSVTEKVDEIVSAIRQELNVDKPGNGIIYVQNINKTYGIYD